MAIRASLAGLTGPVGDFAIRASLAGVNAPSDPILLSFATRREGAVNLKQVEGAGRGAEADRSGTGRNTRSPVRDQSQTVFDRFL